MFTMIQKTAIAVTLLVVLALGASKGENEMDKILIPLPPDREAKIQAIAIRWNECFLRTGVRPPKDARFVETAHRGESDCDTLKMCYVTGNWTVSITQTICMFSLQVAHAEWDDTTRLSRAQVEAIAR